MGGSGRHWLGGWFEISFGSEEGARKFFVVKVYQSFMNFIHPLFQ